MATISTQNKLDGETPSRESDAAIGFGDDEKDDFVRGDQERHSTADAQDADFDDAKSFLRYDERRW